MPANSADGSVEALAHFAELGFDIGAVDRIWIGELEVSTVLDDCILTLALRVLDVADQSVRIAGRCSVFRFDSV